MGWMALEEIAMWMNNASHTADIGFFRVLSHLRILANKFLVFGRLWRPPDVRVVAPSTGMPVTLVCDFGTLGSTEAITPVACCNVSNALVSAWTNQNGTELGVAMANHGALSVQVLVDVALPKALRSVKKLVGRSLGSGAPQTIPTQRSVGGMTAQLTYNMPGLSAVVFELLSA